MTQLLSVFLSVATLLSGQLADPASSPIGHACYEVGIPIMIRFYYSGDKEDWDANFSFNTEENPPLISLGASAVFVLSKGIGPFESRVTRERSRYQQWELLEAPRGKVVVPKNKKFGGSTAYMITMNEPFDHVVDLTEFFELEEPGIYTLVWGCRPNYLQEIIFEVLP